ncbi:MAG: membrane protein insertase YidC [Bacteroidetes bacterium]|nr:membrane protein insertase YidC [Bacteroidota bacterium]MBL7103058.1 membrane protein insertase YidC [Bacteroidales bacterium]
MNRNTIIGLVLIFAILFGFWYFNKPSEEEIAADRHRQDSIAQVRRTEDSIARIMLAERRKQDSIRKAQEVQTTQVVATDSSQINVVNRDKLGIFTNSSVGQDKLYILENEVMIITVSAKGGKIISVQLKEFHTYDSLPLILFDPDKTNFGLTFFANNRIINTNDLYFQVYGDGGSSNLSMRLYADASATSFNKNNYIEFLYALNGNDYMMDFDINFVGMNNYLDQGSNYVDLDWNTELLKLEKDVDRFNGPTVYYKYYKDDVDYLSETKDDEEKLTTRIKWVSFKQRFFSSTLIAKDFFLNADVKALNLEEQYDRYLRSVKTTIGLPVNISEESNIPMSFYFGPNKFSILKKYNLDLERQIPMGWSFFLMAWINRYAVLPVFTFLGGFGWNYGIIILILTILLKTVLFPIAYKSYRSSAKMRVLKPDIEVLGKKFPKKEDAMKKQQATMALYKQAGVNPMAGCIPMLLQFPILIAMFRFFPSAFELRQKSFLWADDLSSYDSILNLPFEIPFYGDHVSLFTLLMTVSTIIYTKVNQDLMGSAQQQMPGMKMMMYMMPIMFLGIFNNYASALSYYYFLANIITFGQMYLIRKTIDEDKIRKQIELNKKKTKKKSKWQQRIETAAKQRGHKPPKRK